MIAPFPECKDCRCAGMIHCAHPQECGSGLYEATGRWRQEHDCPVCGEDHDGSPPMACETGDGI